ncbi:MAG: FixH family protein [Thiogranum sp.]
MHEQSAVPLTPRPWYRQAWPWFLISLPASAVFGGIATIIIAVQSPNALVVDDYYKEGLAINQKIHRQTTARDMGLNALLRSDGRQLSLELNAAEPVPDSNVTLQFIHVTRAELDREVVMQRRPDGRYHAALPALANGTWNLRLHGADDSWEIGSRLTVDGPFQTYLANGR